MSKAEYCAHGQFILEHDWSNHACSWRELRLRNLDVVSLPRLSLRNLERLTTEGTSIVYLPQLDLPDGLVTVQRAMANLSHLGKLALTEGSHNMFSRRMNWFIEAFGQDEEQTVAEMITIAAKFLGSNARSSTFKHLQHSPPVLSAVTSWGRPCLEEVDLYNYDLQPHVWQSLQQLHKLHTVVLHPHEDEEEDEVAVADRHTMSLQISNAVCDVAQHFVIPTGKSLCIKGVLQDSFEVEQDEDLNVETLFLQAAIQNGLPAGSQLASIEFVRAPPINLSIGDKHVWSIVIAPL